ncbi:hypothetical protein ABZX72_29485 [Streptomyces cyaneofuscatus]
MALPKSISTDDLRRKNAESQAARAAEKRGSAPTGQQQKGR